jgi:mannosyltransferase OCH1-like enzyme
MKSWKEKLRGYEFVLWNCDRFDIHSSIWVQEAFEAKKYATAADFIRLYAVYNFGGIYLDMDIEVIKPFDDLLNQKYFIAMESEAGLEAAVLGFEKGSEVIKTCLDYYSNRSYYHTRGGEYKNTIPLPQTMLHEIRKKYRIINRKTIELQETIDTLEVFQPDYFTAKSFSTGKIGITKNTYCIHHFAGSWTSEYEKRFIAKKWYIRQNVKSNSIKTVLVRLYYCEYLYKEFGFKYVLKKIYKKAFHK